MDYKDYYKTLNLEKSADDKSIKDSYRKLARKFHPDLNPGNKRAEEKFKEINEAYEVLSDANKRVKYDSLGSDWQNQAGPEQRYQGRQRTPDFSGFQFNEESAGGGDFSDFFRTIFGGGGFSNREAFGGMEREAPAQADVESTIELDLKDAFLGGERSFQLQAQDDCESCGGKGRLSRNNTCPSCRGAGRIAKTKRLTVKIPQCVKDGSKIRISGQGNPVAGGRKGDLYLVIRIKQHSFFEVKGDNLHCEVPVTIYELLLGVNLDVPTFKGKVTIKVPELTQNGSIFRLKEMGLCDSSGIKGDLMVKVSAVIPKSLNSKQRGLIEELKKLNKDEPRSNLSL